MFMILELQTPQSFYHAHQVFRLCVLFLPVNAPDTEWGLQADSKGSVVEQSWGRNYESKADPSERLHLKTTIWCEHTRCCQVSHMNYGARLRCASSSQGMYNCFARGHAHGQAVHWGLIPDLQNARLSHLAACVCMCAWLCPTAQL